MRKKIHLTSLLILRSEQQRSNANVEETYEINLKLVFKSFEYMIYTTGYSILKVQILNYLCNKVCETFHSMSEWQFEWIPRFHFSAYGALPMYFDLMGPHFVISIRSTLGDEWYEALVRTHCQFNVRAIKYFFVHF